MSDTVVVMNAGRIEQTGSPRDIYDRPATRFVAQFVGEASVLACKATGADGNGQRLVLDDGQTLVTAERDLPAGALSAIIRPERLSLARPGLPTIRGTVTDSTYLGDKIRIEAHLGGGRMVALLDGQDQPPETGAAVTFAYDPIHVRVVSS